MNANEAKQLVREKKEKESLRTLYARIRDLATKGLEYVELRPHDLTVLQAEILRAEGFKVEEEKEDSSHHYDRPQRLGWTVSWRSS